MARPRPGARPSSSSPRVTPARTLRPQPSAPARRWIGTRALPAQPAPAPSATNTTKPFWRTSPVRSDAALILSAGLPPGHRRAARAIKGSRQQRFEARLLEVTVTGESFRKTFILHHDKGNAVGQRPILVRPAGK